jgi:hypothetical protein
VTGSATARASCPAASSSASPWPGPSPAGPRSSSPTSPPATSTRTPAPRSSSFMRRAVDELGQTIVMVTHDPVAASYADRVVFLADGTHRARHGSTPTADAVIDQMKQHRAQHLHRALDHGGAFAFVAGSFILADSLRGTFNDLIDGLTGDTDLQVRSSLEIEALDAVRDPLPRELVDEVAAVPGVALAEGSYGRYAQMLDPTASRSPHRALHAGRLVVSRQRPVRRQPQGRPCATGRRGGRDRQGHRRPRRLRGGRSRSTSSSVAGSSGSRSSGWWASVARMDSSAPPPWSGTRRAPQSCSTTTTPSTRST